MNIHFEVLNAFGGFAIGAICAIVVALLWWRIIQFVVDEEPETPFTGFFVALTVCVSLALGTATLVCLLLDTSLSIGF